jgi:flagellar FliL protein
MGNLKSSLPRLIGRVFIVIIGISVVLSNLASSYIVFAPDSWPKPFYLLYRMPTPAPVPTENPIQEDAAPTNAPGDSEAEGTPAGKNPLEGGENPVFEEVSPGQGVMIDTGAKIVNLAEPNGRRYVRVNIVLEFAPQNPDYYSEDEEKKQAYITKFTEEVNARLPVLNDTMITLFSSKTFEQVYMASGKEVLREELIRLINSRLPEYKVIYVYFTEFVVQ